MLMTRFMLAGQLPNLGGALPHEGWSGTQQYAKTLHRQTMTTANDENK